MRFLKELYSISTIGEGVVIRYQEGEIELEYFETPSGCWISEFKHFESYIFQALRLSFYP
jgi:hypothetical protein